MSKILPDAKCLPHNERLFDDISKLWGNHSYVDFQNSLRDLGWLGAFGLQIFAVGIKTAPSRVLCIMVIILLHPHLRALNTHADILLYGPSRNNDLILQRVAALLDGKFGQQSFVVEKASVGMRIRAAMRWRQITVISQALSPYVNTHSFLALQLMLTAAARVYFGSNLARCRATAVILANDHSPMQVGLRGAANHHDLKCIYCQHAPISALYPSLKFDLSLLSNKASLTAYQAIGPVQGDIAFLALSRSNALPISTVNNIATVGMCLSRVWDHDNVVKRLNELCANPHVTKIVLRAHPEHRHSFGNLIALDPRITLAQNDDIASFAQKCDLVVVPGSGVLIELLHHGVACIYTGDLDQLGHDPHGFVAAGLAADWTQRSLIEISQDIDAYFDENWRRGFADYNPAVGTDPNVLDNKVRAALQKVLS